MLNEQKLIRLMFLLMTGIFSSVFCNLSWAATINCTDAGFVPCSGSNSTTCQTTCEITSATQNQDASGNYFYNYQCPIGYSTGNNRIYSGNNISASEIIPTTFVQIANLQNQGYMCAYTNNYTQGYTGSTSLVQPGSYQYFANLYTGPQSQGPEGPTFIYVFATSPVYYWACCPAGTGHNADGTCQGATCVGNSGFTDSSGSGISCSPTCGSGMSQFPVDTIVKGWQPYCVPMNTIAASPLQEVCIYTGPSWTPSPIQTTGCTSSPGTQGESKTPDATSVCPPVLTPMLPGPGTTTSPGF